MTRQVTDQLYIELDYFTPEEYYNYQAEAVSAQSAEFAVDAVVGRLYEFTVTCDALFTPDLTVEVTKNSFAVLDASSSLDASADVIRTTDAQLNLVSSQTTDADRSRETSLDISAQFDQTTVVERIQELSATISSEFTILVDATSSSAIECFGSWTSDFALDVVVELYKDMASSMSVTASTDALNDRIRDVDSTQAVEFAQVLDNTRIRDVDSTISAESTANILIGKIVQGECAFDALFAPSMTADVVKNTFAVLDSTAALTTVVNANRSAQVALSSIINQSLQGDRVRDYAATLESEFTQSIEYSKQVPAQADLTVQASITDTSIRIRYATANIAGAFSPNITANLTKQGQISLSSTFTQSTSVRRNRFATATLSSAFELTNNVTEINQRQAFVAGLDLNYYSAGLPGGASGDFVSQGFQDSVTDQFGFVYSVGVEVSSQNANARTTNNLIVVKHDPRGRLVWQKAITNQFGSQYSTFARVALHNNYLFVSISGYNVTSAPLAINYLLGKIYRFDLTTNLSTTSVISMDHVITDMKVYSGSLFTNGFKPFIYQSTSVLNTNIVARYNTSTMANLWSTGYGYGTNGIYRSDPNRSTFEVNSTGIYGLLVTDPDVGTNTEKGAYYKLDFAGTVQTFRLLNFRPLSIAVDSSSNIYISGYDRNNTVADYVLVKYNSSLVQQWSKTMSTTTTTANQKNYTIRLNSNQDLVVVETDQWQFQDTNTSISIINSSGVKTRTGRLKILKNTTAEQTNACMTSFDINISDGWMQLGTHWIRSETSTYPTVDKIEGIVYQLEDDLSTNNFRNRIIADYSDNDNYYLDWSVTDVNTTLTDYTVGTISSATVSYFTGSSTGMPNSEATTAIAYTEIPLYVTVEFAGDLSANFAITANNRRLRSTPVTTNIIASVVSSAVKTARITKTLDSVATIIPNGGYVRGITANLQSNAQVTASLGLTKRYNADLSTQAVLTVSSRKYVGNGASLFAESTLVEQTNRIRESQATLTAFDTQLTGATKIGRGIIQCDVVAQATINAIKTTVTNVDAISVVTQTSEPVKTVRAHVDVTATATFTVDAKKLPQTPVLMQSEFAQSTQTNNSKITRITASLASTVQTTVNAVKTARTSDTLATSATLSFGNQVTRLRLAESSQQALATILAPAVKTARTSAQFQAFNTTVVVANKISFDAALLLRIPAEQRTLIVPEEIALLAVPEETRVNMVRKIAI